MKVWRFYVLVLGGVFPSHCVVCEVGVIETPVALRSDTGIIVAQGTPGDADPHPHGSVTINDLPLTFKMVGILRGCEATSPGAGTIVVQETPGDPNPHPHRTLAIDDATLAFIGMSVATDPRGSHQGAAIIVQGTLGDPDPHPERTATVSIDDHDTSFIPFESNSNNSASFGLACVPPPQVSDLPDSPGPASGRQWVPLVHLDPWVVLNPLGAQNGDGPPKIGMAQECPADPLTIVWAKQVTPGNHDPVFSRFIDGAWTEPELISSQPGDDLDPEWQQEPSGTIHSIWRRTDTVGGASVLLYASRPLGEESFSNEEWVSGAGEDVRGATLAVRSSGELLVAYEAGPMGGVKQIIVAAKDDLSRVFHSRVIASTAFEAPEPFIADGCGHTWVIWTDSAEQVAYRELSDGDWSAPSYEAYSKPGDAGKARMKVQTRLCTLSKTKSEHVPSPPSNSHTSGVVVAQGTTGDSNPYPPGNIAIQENPGSPNPHPPEAVVALETPGHPNPHPPVTIMVQETPGDPDPHPPATIVAQENPGDPDPHPPRSFAIGDSWPDPFASKDSDSTNHRGVSLPLSPVSPAKRRRTSTTMRDEHPCAEASTGGPSRTRNEPGTE